MPGPKIVARGYVLVWKRPLTQETVVSAIVQRAQVDRLARRQGGRIVDVKGHAYKLVQQGQLRVLVDPSAVL